MNNFKSKLKIFRILQAEFRESFFMAMNAIAAHKLRSALTLLGILVGVFSIIVVMTTMRAMRTAIEKDLNTLGGETFAIQKYPAVSFRRPDAKIRERKEITLFDGTELQKRATLARNVGLESAFAVEEISSVFTKAPPDAQLVGESPGGFPAHNWVAATGRVLIDADVSGTRTVCVLGNKLADSLFPFGSAIGQRVKINGIYFTIIGILEASGATRGGNQDNFAVIPITTAFDHFGNRRQNISLVVQSRSLALVTDTLEQVRGILRALRKVPPGAEDDFEILTRDSMMEQINNFTLAVRVGISAVSSIALIAAGIGIMNIMLVSVTERTREIGIRRAIGAKKRNIMTQFIFEAILLCQIGGALGVALGIFGGNLAGHFLQLPAVIPYDWAVIGLVICSLVGLIFGVYPAYKAANLDPIESLRYE